MITFMIACFFYACDSTSNNQLETNPPIINMSNPDSNDHVINGDTIDFVGQITDDTKLHSLLIKITSMEGDIYYEYNPVVDGLATFSFNTPWLVSGIPFDTTGYLDIIATDQSGNYAFEHWYMRLRN